MEYQLAQINIARLIAPLDDPRIEEFVNQLDIINSQAEQSPGFVWRLKDENNNTTGINPYDDPLMIVNMSVWESTESLMQFTYRTSHAEVFKNRKKWFLPMNQSHLALWWITLHQFPSAEEGKARLDYLDKFGASIEAFTFKKIFIPH